MNITTKTTEELKNTPDTTYTCAHGEHSVRHTNGSVFNFNCMDTNKRIHVSYEQAWGMYEYTDGVFRYANWMLSRVEQ
jgi:hypothetical protein